MNTLPTQELLMNSSTIARSPDLSFKSTVPLQNATHFHQVQANSNKYILIVDDSQYNLNLISQILKERGYRVRCTTNGNLVLKTVQYNLPDLILLDILLPDLDGYQVCEALKADAATCHIPIVFLSALNEPFDQVKAFQVGGVDYISKPFKIEELIVRIENQLLIQEQKLQLQKEIQTRKITEGILRQKDATLQGIMRAIPDVLLRVSSEGQILGILSGQNVTSERDDMEALLPKIRDLLPDRLAQQRLDFIQLALQNRGIQVYEYEVEIEEILYFEEARIVPIARDEVLLMIRDISDRKRTEQALKTANRELLTLAHQDGLTKMANRRFFDRQLQQEWQRSMREQNSLSLILCDVDYFKNYNDRYGHQEGDRCLIQIAKAISRGIRRSGDLVARYGGEEFAIILPNTPPKGAATVAELIRQEIQQLNIPHDRSNVSDRVTLSLGVASLVPSRQKSPEDLILIADRALYEAKNNGRDRLIVGHFEGDRNQE